MRERQATYRASPTRAKFRRVSRKQIDAVVQKIVDEFDPDQVILFGSYAYGKPTVDSDVDVLIVAESNERPAQRATRAYHAVHGKTFPMDILVRTPQEMAQRLAIGDFFYSGNCRARQGALRSMNLPNGSPKLIKITNMRSWDYGNAELNFSMAYVFIVSNVPRNI